MSIRMTEKEFKALKGVSSKVYEKEKKSSRAIEEFSKKPSKYRNEKIILDGREFDSKKEGMRYLELRSLEYSGQISNLELQPKFELQEHFRDNHGKMHRAINYIGDFMYEKEGNVIVEDTKGVKTQAFSVKEKLFRKKYPDITLIVL